jgi:hypothetical protein
VVVPVKVMVVPVFNPVRSRVLPAGTAIEEIVIDVYEAFAEATSSNELIVIDWPFTTAANARARPKRDFAVILAFLDRDAMKTVGLETKP